MSEVLPKMVIGEALGLLGGVIGIVATAYAWNGTVECAPLVGMNLLVAMMFFAAAGTFTKYSPVKGTTITVLAALCVAFTVIGLFYETMILWLGLILIVLGIALIACGACPGVVNWTDQNRSA